MPVAWLGAGPAAVGAASGTGAVAERGAADGAAKGAAKGGAKAAVKGAGGSKAAAFTSNGLDDAREMMKVDTHSLCYSSLRVAGVHAVQHLAQFSHVVAVQRGV